jgi:hypothetical protein
MASRYDLTRRLEPIRPTTDLDRGFRAEVADPYWFLGRQWQMGEHQGEDAASPVRVRTRASHTPIDPLEGDEAMVESEPFDWWTPGRRVRIGLAAAPHVPAASQNDPTLRLARLPFPYQRLEGAGYDGLALYLRRVELGLPDAVFADVPPTEPVDLWQPDELVYRATFQAGGVDLALPRHDGGDVDWYSVSANAPIPAPAAPPDPVEMVPGRLKYPGAPHPRWWQIENTRVDIGGFPPDRSHFATMLLIDLVVSHTDDWFTFPLVTTAGTVVTVHEVVVTDSFDEDFVLANTGTWGLFRVHGLDDTSLVVWPTVANPLTGPIEDEVVIGIDEDANLLWAVEQRAGGRELAPPPTGSFAPPPSGEVLGNARAHYAYRASTALPRHWHPYVVEEIDGRRKFVQGRLADLDARPPTLMPEPVSPLLRDPGAAAGEPVHAIEPATVPTMGLRLERRHVLGRRTDGLPVLWMQRRRLPLLGPPVSGLRFDVVDPIPTVVS